MFETWSGSEIPLPKELAPNGERLWSYVHLQLQTLWFFVEVEHVEEATRFASTYLLSSVAQLNSLGRDSTVDVLAVHLVSPSHLNNSDGWKMQRVKKIVRGTQRAGNDPLTVTIYHIDEGQIIVDPPHVSPLDLDTVELLFEISP